MISSSNSRGGFILNPEAEERVSVLSNDEAAGSWETATPALPSVAWLLNRPR